MQTVGHISTPKGAPRVLVACEYSGRVRDALRALGVDAISADLLPTEAPGPHYQGDVLPLLQARWAGVVAHPPCTYLTNAGARWLYVGGAKANGFDSERVAAVRTGAAFFLACYHANAPHVIVENPVMHRLAREAVGVPMNFSRQPWQFGTIEGGPDNCKKRTCFWTRGGIKPFKPLDVLDGTTARDEVYKASPGPDRWKTRSTTYPGMAQAIARAMAAAVL